MNLPNSINRLIDTLSRFPSIGPRQATRIVFYLINRGKNEINALARDIDAIKDIKICERCFFIHQNKDSLCDICRNKNRDASTIAIVEKETDLISIENTGKFTGRYLILGTIPKTGILEDSQKLRLETLKRFIQKELGEQSSPTGPAQAKEIILAFNPTAGGDFNASLISKELGGFAKKISRLGRGLPYGGEIEFADNDTLGNAIEKRE